MNENKRKLSGVFAPVTTPFRDDQPDQEALAFNLRRLRRTGLTGYLALGSNGEAQSLTDKERRLVLEVFAREKGDKVVMVGTGCESTAETIEKSHMAVQMGFDYVSILPPHYFPKLVDAAALIRHYERVAEEVAAPVLLYNAPQFTGGVTIPPKAIVELSRHPNVAGIKDSAAAGPGRYMVELEPQQDFSVLAGSINTFYSSLHLGATGGILSVGNVVPDRCAELHDLFKRAMYVEAREVNAGLVRLSQAISGRSGVAGVKAAMDLVGLKGGRPRDPLAPVTGERVAEIKEALIAEGLLISFPEVE